MNLANKDAEFTMVTAMFTIALSGYFAAFSTSGITGNFHPGTVVMFLLRVSLSYILTIFVKTTTETTATFLTPFAATILKRRLSNPCNMAFPFIAGLHRATNPFTAQIMVLPIDKVAATAPVPSHGSLIPGHPASGYTLSASKFRNKTAASLVIDAVGFFILRYTTPLDGATTGLSTVSVYLDSITPLNNVLVIDRSNIGTVLGVLLTMVSDASFLLTAAVLSSSVFSIGHHTTVVDKLSGEFLSNETTYLFSSCHLTFVSNLGPRATFSSLGIFAAFDPLTSYSAFCFPGISNEVTLCSCRLLFVSVPLTAPLSGSGNTSTSPNTTICKSIFLTSALWITMTFLSKLVVVTCQKAFVFMSTS